MKMTKNVLFGAAVLAVASLGFFGCSPEELGDSDLIEISNNDAKAYYMNEGRDSAGNEVKYRRAFKTPRSTNWKEAIYKLTLHSDMSNATIGLVFDDEVNATTGANSFFNFAVTKTTSGGLACYLSRFNDVTDMEGTTSSFGTEYELLKGTGKTDYYHALSNVEDGDDGSLSVYVGFQQVDVSSTTTKEYAYVLGVFGSEADAKGWFRASDDDLVNLTNYNALVTAFNVTSTNRNSSDFSELSSHGSITDFTVEAGTSKRDKKVGFYAMAGNGGVFNGAWECINRDLEAEVLEDDAE